MKKLVFTVVVALLTVVTLYAQPRNIPELKTIFDEYNVDGSILIYDQNANSYSGYNIERCNVLFSPASTFKIPNTLIAIETGVASPNTVFKWDGKKRTFPHWEKDMDVYEAYKASCVPVYQEIARRIGVERMQTYLRLFNYGSMDVNAENIDKFWLEGKSSITQFQQIYFLKQMYNYELPVRKESIDQLKKVMVNEKTSSYTLSAKTGWAMRQSENVTWFVGYVEAKDNVYYFATNVEANESTNINNFSQVRIDLTKAILRKLDIID